MSHPFTLAVLPFYLVGRHGRWAIFLLVLVTSLSPRIHLGVLQYGKLLDMRWEDLLIVMLIGGWLIKASLRSEKIVLSPLGMPILGYLSLSFVWTGVGVIFGWLDALRALLFYFKEVEFLLFFFITVNLIRGMNDVKTVLVAFVLGGVANAFYLLYQLGTGRIGGMESPWDFYRYYGISMVGESGPGVTGNYFALIAFLAIAVYLLASRKTLRLLALALGAMSIGGLVGSMSRTSMVGFAATIPVLVVLVLSISGSKGSKSRLAGLLCLLMGIGIVVYSVGGKIREDLPYAVRIADLSIETYQRERVEDTYEDYFRVIHKNPILGLGKSITGQQKIPGVQLEVFYGEAHNQYLRVMAEVGVVGLVFFLYIFFRAGKCSLRVFRMGAPFSRIIGLACLVNIAFLLITSMAQDVFIMARAIELFWVLLGLCMVVYRWDGRM